MKHILTAISLALLCVTFSACRSSNIGETAVESKEEKKEVYIPRDLEDCFDELDRMLDEKTKDEIRTGFLEPADLHFSAGMSLRNNWGLWRDSSLAQYFKEMGIDHPDMMSSIIWIEYARYLRDSPNRIKSEELTGFDAITYLQDYQKELSHTGSNQTSEVNEQVKSLDN